MKKIKIFFKAMVSLLAHLVVCLIIALVAYLLVKLTPWTSPYIEVFAGALSICILSVWYVSNFGLSIWNVWFHVIAMALSILVALFVTLDWIFSWGMIFPPWRYVCVFETFFLVMLFLFSLLFIIGEEDTKLVGTWPEST